MSKVNEKYASEALLSEEAKKKLGLVIKNGSVTTAKLKDGAVTPDKLEPGLWENIDSTNRETQEGLNRLQEWMNEFAGGLEITANTDSYEAGKSASVTITAKTKTGKKGDWVIRDSNNVTVYEESDASQITYNQTIDKDTYYSIICKQGDQIATGQLAIIAAFPTWLGAGNSYTDIKTDAYKRVVGKKVEGRYEVTISSGQRIYLLTPKEVVISKVTMGGFEIPMNDVEEVTLAISGYGNKVYKVYESSNTYQEGTYQVSVNVSDSELVEHIEAIDKKIDNYPVADGEDIIAVTKTQPTEQQVLMLADKAYHPASFSGLGRKYLRKNIIPIEHEYRVFGGFVENVEVETHSATITSGSPLNVVFDRVKEVFLYGVGLGRTKKYYMSWSSEEVPMSDYALTSEPLDMIFMYNGVPYKWDGENLLVDDEIQEDGLINLLTQDMINEPNTIYHIQYDYDLNGEEITIPEGCTLEFEGGSLRNGTIVGSGTSINAGLSTIFKNDLNVSGVWSINEAYPEWFGAVGDGDTDDTLALKKVISFGAYNGVSIFFDRKTFAVYDTITLSSDGISLRAKRNSLVNNISKKFDGALFNVQTTTPVRHFSLYGIMITGNNHTGCMFDFDTDTNVNNRVANLYIDNCCFRNCNDIILKISHSWYGYIKQTLFEYCKTSLYLNIGINCYNFIGCSFYGCETAVSINNECYSNCFINCTFQATNTSFYISTAYGLSIHNCYFESNGTVDTSIIEANDIYGLNVCSCIFTNGGSNRKHIFDISHGHQVSIKDNFISPTFNDNVQLRGTINQFDIQSSVLTRSNLSHSSLGEGFTSLSLVYHRPDWINNVLIGTRCFYTKYSDGSGPIADLIWNGKTWVKTGSFVDYSVPYFGESSVKPTDDSKIHEGFCFYDTTLKKPIFRNFGKWRDAQGYIALSNRGSSENRPTNDIISSDQSGYCYFDTDLKKNIYAHYDTSTETYWYAKYGMSVYKLASTYNLVSDSMYLLAPIADGTTTIGFCATNDGTTEPIIVLSLRYSTSYKEFKVPNLEEYPYLYISNDKASYQGQELHLKVKKIITTWEEEDGATAGVNRSGTFAEKPAASDIYVGFKYFCTDKQTAEGQTNGIEIIHKGNDVWVDALGRVVS